MFIISPMINPILDILHPLETPRPKIPLFLIELFIDEEKYFYPIYILSIILTVIDLLILFGFLCLLSSLIQHCEGLLNVLQLLFLLFSFFEDNYICHKLYKIYSFNVIKFL